MKKFVIELAERGQSFLLLTLLTSITTFGFCAFAGIQVGNVLTIVVNSIFIIASIVTFAYRNKLESIRVDLSEFLMDVYFVLFCMWMYFFEGKSYPILFAVFVILSISNLPKKHES